ncbi:isoprenyl transferase [Dethiosulfatarculus sandiegensis]|nr:isoprenyl transferase [Dethiosulfatarculus sandiegensis]
MKKPLITPPAPQGPDGAISPRHVAIIMDGNGRWAQKRGWQRIRGHEAGSETVRVIVRNCRKLNIPYLTLYAFSSENWGRPKTEVAALMSLLRRFLSKELDELLARGIRLNAIGDIDLLPENTRQALLGTMEKTAHLNDMVLTLALSYGGRAELLHATKKLCQKVASGLLDPEQISEEDFSQALYTHDLPDPDLMIRTSGEIRISNFLPWQLAYSEFYFTKTPWPDFGEEELKAALTEYSGRQRRYGKTGEQVAK